MKNVNKVDIQSTRAHPVLFGRKNKLSVEFFNHAADFSDTIAFIIPNPWKMYSIHKRLDNRFKLVYEEQLESFSFLKLGESRGKRHLEDNSTNVNCVFQIWTKEETDLPDLRKYEKDPKSHPDFTTYGYFADKNNIPDDLDFDFLDTLTFCDTSVLIALRFL